MNHIAVCRRRDWALRYAFAPPWGEVQGWINLVTSYTHTFFITTLQHMVAASWFRIPFRSATPQHDAFRTYYIHHWVSSAAARSIPDDRVQSAPEVAWSGVRLPTHDSPTRGIGRVLYMSLGGAYNGWRAASNQVCHGRPARRTDGLSPRLHQLEYPLPSTPA